MAKTTMEHGWLPDPLIDHDAPVCEVCGNGPEYHDHDSLAWNRLMHALEAAEHERDDQHKAWNKASWERDEAQAEAARLREALEEVLPSEDVLAQAQPGQTIQLYMKAVDWRRLRKALEPRHD